MQSLKRGTIPLSVFDLHGFLAPGATLLLLCYLFEAYARQFYLDGPDQLVTPMYFVFNSAIQKVLLADKVSWTASFLVLFLFAGISYVAGHVIASLAHGFLGEILMAKGSSQPYCHLLGIGVVNNRQRRVANFHRGLFFWINLYLVFRFLDLVDVSAVTWLPHPPAWILAILGWFILGVFVLLLFSELVWNWFGRRLARVGSFRVFWRFVDAMNLIFAWPFNTLFRLGQGFINVEAFPESFSAAYKKHFRKRFGMRAEKAGSVNYWFSYFYTLDKSDSFDMPLSTWSQQYVFARNLSAAFFLPFFYGILWLGAHQGMTYKANSLLPVLPLLCLLVAMLLLMRFFYLYYNYAHRYVYQAFVYTSMSEEEKAAMATTAAE